MRIRQGDLCCALSLCAVLSMHYANERLRISFFPLHNIWARCRLNCVCMFVSADAWILSWICIWCCLLRVLCVCVRACVCVRQVGMLQRSIVQHVCSPSLSPRACLVQKRAEKPETGFLWLIRNIDFTLTADQPLIHGHTSADVRFPSAPTWMRTVKHTYIQQAWLCIHT